MTKIKDFILAHKMWFIIAALMIIAYLTRNSWFPKSAKIVITNVDWDGKTVTFEEYFNGKKISSTPQTAKLGDGNGIQVLSNGLKYYRSTNSDKDTLILSIYGHYLQGVATKDYNTLACMAVDFANKTQTDCTKK